LGWDGQGISTIFVKIDPKTPKSIQNR